MPRSKNSKKTENLEKEPIESLIASTIEKIRSMVDSNIVVGEQISNNSQKSVFPLSRVSVGFVSGGGEYSKKQDLTRPPYAGGAGAGFSVTPIGLIVIDKEDVKYIKVSQSEPFLKLLDVIPEAIKSLKQEKE